jgi:short-subunit dehydrogenase
LGSLVGFQGVPRAANYAATKAFIQTFAEGLRPELKPRGVDVIAVAPGPVASGFAARAHMVLTMSAKPRSVPRETLNALGRRTTVRPGALSKLLEGLFFGLPRSARTLIMTQVMKSMARGAPRGA